MWEIDGRTGTAAIGDERLPGFAFMRDRERRLIAFHAFLRERLDPSSSGPPPIDQFTIEEDAFQPA